MSGLYTVGDSPCIFVFICCYCHIFASALFWLLVFLLYGVDCSEGYCGVSVFEYIFFNLLCYMSKECECNPYILFVGICFVVIWICYNVCIEFVVYVVFI
jgi:hypothetical protein